MASSRKALIEKLSARSRAPARFFRSRTLVPIGASHYQIICCAVFMVAGPEQLGTPLMELFTTDRGCRGSRMLRRCFGNSSSPHAK